MFQMENLIHSDFVPHSVCWLMRSDLIVLHALGDAMIAFAYFLIPPLLIRGTRRFKFDKSLTFIFGVYATFILLCGLTHLFDVVMIWHINEKIIYADGILRVVTGVFSIFSVAVTIWALQIFLTLLSKLLVAYNKITNERSSGGATPETIQEWETTLKYAKSFLEKREGLTDGH